MFPTREEKRNKRFMEILEEQLKLNRSRKQAYKETKKILGKVGNESYKKRY